MVNQFSGIFFQANSSQSYDAICVWEAGGWLRVRLAQEDKSYSTDQYDIEPKLGKTDRILRFNDGARFETNDHEAFSQFEAMLGKRPLLDLVHWMESRWRYALISIMGIVLFCLAFLEYGVPAVAKGVAYQIPQSVRRSISDESLQWMEQSGFLDDGRVRRLKVETARSAFRQSMELLGDQINPIFEYKLHVYKGEQIGANAFALPSGDIIATEGFIDLCENENQIIAVFLHEIAHVELQHGMRSVIQDAGVVALASIVLGDVSSIAGLAGSLPTIALESRYSQKFELEADAFSARILEDRGIGAESLESILIRLHKDTPDLDIAQILSTHPTLKKRIDKLRTIRSAND